MHFNFTCRGVRVVPGTGTRSYELRTGRSKLAFAFGAVLAFFTHYQYIAVFPRAALGADGAA